MFISIQRYTSSPVKLTNTEAGTQGTTSLTWTAVAPSDHSCCTATWQVTDTHLQTLPPSIPAPIPCVSPEFPPFGRKAELKQCFVFCPPEDKTWTVVEHNNTEATKVRPQPGTNQLAVHFEYASEEEQLAAIISQSEHCEQELTYHCRRSRIFNSPGKIHHCVNCQNFRKKPWAGPGWTGQRWYSWVSDQ